ncbi:MAG: DNA helicase RecQ [Rhodospirillaceae bacterium]|nr:DNA helicase RecQ [Rhodospirillaceae bacterium]|tara:strand:- start:502 stop:2328 length:1827 start_codon:yes stop_codon:yes gene_type:complete
MYSGDLNSQKLSILNDVYGFQSFRTGQEQVVDSLLAGENTLAVMPTGSGKSLCFQIPSLILGGLTVVVSPLVALMQDQVAALRLNGVAAETINSGRARSDNIVSWRNVKSGLAPLLYMAPERLMSERMLVALKELPVKLFAIDEAHCISQWGPAFRPEYEELCRLTTLFPNTPIAALTATADEATRQDIVDRLFGKKANVYVTGFNRPNIKLSVTGKHDWRKQMLSFVDKNKGNSGIIYCLSRKKTDETTDLLIKNGYNAYPYHAGMNKSVREKNQDSFMTQDGVIMVATIAFGMGIDKPDIRFVLHADLPSSIEAYYQEIGRAGRDGKPADVLMLYGLEDIRMRRIFIEQEEGGNDRRRREHQRLTALLGYCEAPSCRRKTLLSYFGENSTECGNCDVCLEPGSLAHGTTEAILLINTILETGEVFGAGHIIDVIRGSTSDKIHRLKHEFLDMYGTGIGKRKEEWQSILRQLVASGFLEMNVREYGSLKVTKLGHSIKSGEQYFKYRKLAFNSKNNKLNDPIKLEATKLNGLDATLLKELKALRSQLARARKVPPYVVFTDRALHDMTIKSPRNKDEFSKIHGVGAKKLKDLAQPFIELIKNIKPAV